MADKILHKRSSTPSAVPSAASLELGELALNTADGRAFMKKSNGSVVEIGSNGSAFFSLVTVTATSVGQTSFTIPGGYTPGAILVFLNGSSLAPVHYTATNGTTVVLASGTGVVVGSELVVMRLSAFQVADALPLGGTAADSSKLGGQPPEFYLGGGSWGSITGTLANQDDLQTALNSKANSADIDFTIIYPNGGSAASPANVSINSRYIVDNPFPGHHIFCQAEIRIGGRWYTTGWYSDYVSGSRAYGTRASFDGTELIVQTGKTALSTLGVLAGGTYTAGDVFTPSPCRVKVWKVKGAIA